MNLLENSEFTRIKNDKIKNDKNDEVICIYSYAIPIGCSIIVNDFRRPHLFNTPFWSQYYFIIVGLIIMLSGYIIIGR